MKLLISLLLSCPALAQQVDWVTQVRNKPVQDARQYDFPAQAFTAPLTGGVSKTLTIQCPLGVSGSPVVPHWLRVYGGTGTAEVVRITGGTCTSGAPNKTIIFTPAHNHSGTWQLGSATSGGQEAMLSTGSPVTVYYPTGRYRIYGPLTAPPCVLNSNLGGGAALGYCYLVDGGGARMTTLIVDSSFPSTGHGPITLDAGTAASVKHLTIQFPTAPDNPEPSDYKFTVSAANATVGATYTNNAVTFTVAATIAGATTLYATASSSPTASGTLTKASGTGDSTITFSAFVPPYTQWPAGIDVTTGTGATYGTIENVEIINAWVGIDCVPQSGNSCSGFEIHDARVSGYSHSIRFVSGMQDTVRISDVFCGAYIDGTNNNALASANYNIGVALPSYGIISNITCLGTLCLDSTAESQVNVTNLQCDTGSCIRITTDSSFLTVAGGYNSSSSGHRFMEVSGSGNTVTVTGMSLFNFGSLESVLVNSSGANNISLSDSSLFSTLDPVNINLTTANHTLSLSNIVFSNALTTRVGPLIQATANGNTFNISNIKSNATTGIGAKLFHLTGGAMSANLDNIIADGWGIDYGSPVGTVRLSNLGLGTAAASPATSGTVASASTIVAPGVLFHVNGTAQINTITLPSNFYTGNICIVPDAAFTTGTSGNIGAVSTAIAGKTMCLYYDPAVPKFYPSY